MKISYAILLASALLASTAHAKHHEKGSDTAHAPAENSAHQGADKLENLNLSDDQKLKVKTIHEEARKKIDAAREEAHQKMLQVLTPEQTKKFEENRQKILERMKSRQDNRKDNRQEARAERRNEKPAAKK